MDINNVLVGKPTLAEYNALPAIVKARSHFDFYYETNSDSGFEGVEGERITFGFNYKKQMWNMRSDFKLVIESGDAEMIIKEAAKYL